MLRIICCAALLLATTAMAQNPVPRVGDACPTGTYRSGDYCKQYPSQSGKEAIVREAGASCPAGWYKSGEYCVKSGEQ
jgi:hypothetical protein